MLFPLNAQTKVLHTFIFIRSIGIVPIEKGQVFDRPVLSLVYNTFYLL